MRYTTLIHQLPLAIAERTPSAIALTSGLESLDYEALANHIEAFSNNLVANGLKRGERVGIYLEKRCEFVIACFGAAAAGGVFVPINPLLKPEQVAYILNDCNVRVLITSPERGELLNEALSDCNDLQYLVQTHSTTLAPPPLSKRSVDWSSMLSTVPAHQHRCIDSDMAAILYTSGSTGKPKGVVLSHRNMVCGAQSVASYLNNQASDTLLAALPLSFDAGFSQLTTAFHVGARVVLLNYLLPRDVIKTIEREKVTGMTAVPPLYIQLAQVNWPESISEHLRYFATTGGRMPGETLATLRKKLPKSQPFLMYGLTEAFRSTYLPPDQVDLRPGSIGKAIPNAEILVLRNDGTPCHPDEPGELVHRGVLVSLGYWNDPEKTAERFKALPNQAQGPRAGLPIPEIAVFSGDTVRMDDDGYIYFIGRQDEMIKTSGYRVSPTEIEEIIYGTGLIGECAAFGVDDEQLGQVIQVVATRPSGTETSPTEILAACRKVMPGYMLPTDIHIQPDPLPRNPNGKIDRQTLAKLWASRQAVKP